MALVGGVPGAEIAAMPAFGLEIGPTIHYFTGTNDLRGSAVNTWELGLKATWLIHETALHEDFYISGAINHYITQVAQTFSDGTTLSTSHFPTWGYVLTAGHQWNLKIRGTDAVTLRLGAGVAGKAQHFETQQYAGQPYILGVRGRFDPTIDFTIGLAI